MSKWQAVTLEDVATLNGGFAFKSSQYTDTGHFVLRTVNITDDYAITKEGATFIAEREVSEFSRFSLQPFDTLFVMVAATLGKVGFVRKKDLPALLNQNMWIIRAKPEKIDPVFLHYLFREVSKIPLSWVSGSARSFLRRDDVRKLPFDLPSSDEQQAIAETLSSLDDKIELNRRMNATLERAAQAIFRDWLVDFGPVRRKSAGAIEPVDILGGLIPDPDQAAVVAALFPNAFNSDDLPAGWRSRSFGDLAEPRKGRNITKKTVVSGNIPVVAGGLNPAYYHNTPNVKGPVVTVSASGANAGIVRLYQQDIWASDCSFISQKQTDNLFTLYTLLLSRQDEIYTMQQGAAQPHIYPSDLKRLAVSDPPKQVWNALEQLLSPMFNLVANNEQENRTLAETRDYLLPRLISGQVRVASAKRKAG